MRLASAALWVALPIVAGSCVYLLKMQVEAQEQRLGALRKDIATTESEIHVLNAEWSYLNDPIRLRDEAERHLGLRPVRPEQVGTIASIPLADAPIPAPVAQDHLARGAIASALTAPGNPNGSTRP